MSGLMRFLMPVVIAVVLGPLIAGVAVCLLALASNLFDDSAAPLGDLLGMFVAYIVIAYVSGAAIALVAGLLVSLWMIWRAPSFAIVIAATAIATAAYMGAGALGLLGVAEITNARSNFLFTLVFALIAAAGCWMLTKRYVRTA